MSATTDEAIHIGGAGARRARALYLQSGPVATFAQAHLPTAGAATGMGVVICPPLGWDEECTYRARRAWAQALADAGHAAIRIDLAGTGDSPEPERPEEQFEAWISSVAGAAAWLRDACGATRISALGIGVGGMLAWIAVAQGAPIDDVMLWGVPPRGRQAVRELRAAAQLEINWQTTAADDPAGSAATDEGLLHQGGQVLPAPTVAALGGLDLRRNPWPQGVDRRVLLFSRTGSKPDRDLVEHLESMDVSLTVADGDGYGPLMRYVQESVVPEEAIQRSLQWLAVPGAHGCIETEALDAPAALPSAEICQDGVLVRETPVSLDLPSGSLFAIITEPATARATDLCAVLSSGGSDRRIGPNRHWVDVARRWAAQGVASVRFDIPGTGDSDGDERALDRLRDHYEPAQIARLVEVLDALQNRGVANRFLLAGFCSGGYRSLQVACQDPRVSGLVCISLPFFRWTWGAVNIRDSWLEVREARPQDSRVKLAVIRSLQRCLKVLKRGHHWSIVLGQIVPNHGERMLAGLVARDVEITLVLKPISNAYEQLTARRRAARMRKVKRLQVRALPGNDGRFRPLVSQSAVVEAMDDALARVLRGDAPQPSRTSDGGIQASTSLVTHSPRLETHRV